MRYGIPLALIGVFVIGGLADGVSLREQVGPWLLIGAIVIVVVVIQRFWDWIVDATWDLFSGKRKSD